MEILDFTAIIYEYVSWLIVVEGDLNAPCSIATIPNIREGRYSFSFLRHINLCWLLNAKSIFIQMICSISKNSV